MFILVSGDPSAPIRHSLESGDTLVGRAPSSDIQLNHVSVSRCHARLLVSPGQCVLEDLGSRNGTFVNGVAIKSAVLKDGDALSIGSVAARIEVSAEDQLKLVEGPNAVPFPYVLNRPVNQTPSSLPAVDAGRLLALISGIAKSLIKEQPLPNVLEEVLRLTLDSIDAERAFLILKDEKSGVLVPRVIRTRDGQESDRAAISRTILNRVMTERVGILTSDAQRDQRFDGVKSIAAQHLGAFMCVPLWNQDTTIGALYLDTQSSEKFSPADLELLTALSNYAAVAIEQARLSTRLNEETRRRERLGRYHSPAVVARILEDGSEAGMPLLAQEREVTVLFADLVGFTTMAEHMAPQEVATILNACFGRMTDIVFDHEGTLDKFIGDALLAVFGAPLTQPDHAARGVAAARAMRLALREMNPDLTGRPLLFRMALNSGIALAGDIGSTSRRDYTVLGDVVNTASRIQSDVAAPGQIVITRATYERVKGDVNARALGPVTLRGRTDPIEVYEVLSSDKPK